MVVPGFVERLWPVTAITVVAAAVGLRLLVDPFVEGVPYITFFPAVFVAAWIAGARAGLLATALSSVCALYLFIEPRFALTPDRFGDLIGLILFVGVGVGFSGVVGALRRTRADLAERERKLREAVAVRDEFLSVAAHELRTPLAAMTIQLESLQRLPPEQIAARGEKKLAGALRQSLRLNHLVDALLSVPKVASGRITMDQVESDLRSIVEEALEPLHDTAARAGSPLTLAAPEPVPGTWDRAALIQVVSNLVGNAIKYGAGKPIEVDVRAGRQRATIVVRDHGIGVARGDRERIFGRFERAVSGVNYGGLGLGLYITRALVEAHGGTIEVASSPGDGATFVVTLPAGSATPSRPPRT